MLETLTTDRLILRPFVADDLDFMAELMGDPAVMAMIGDGPLTRQEAWHKLLLRGGSWQMQGLGSWKICLRNGTAIGEVGFFDALRDPAYGVENTVEAGWSLLPAHWRKGYGREALEAAHAWYDAHAGRLPLIAIIREGHVASFNLARSVGYDHFRDVTYGGRPNQILKRVV